MLTSTIQRFEPPRRIAWTTKTLGFTVRNDWVVVPSHGKTVLRATESFDGLMARIFRRLLRKSVDRWLGEELRRLKAEAERHATTRTVLEHEALPHDHHEHRRVIIGTGRLGEESATLDVPFQPVRADRRDAHDHGEALARWSPRLRRQQFRFDWWSRRPHRSSGSVVDELASIVERSGPSAARSPTTCSRCSPYLSTDAQASRRRAGGVRSVGRTDPGSLTGRHGKTNDVW